LTDTNDSKPDLEKSLTDEYSMRRMLSGVYRVYSPSAADEETARRLARLLVQEIQLYNSRKIAEGRRDKNIYDLVADAIELSRTYFKERMGEPAEEMLPIFEQELIDILCEGDASKLGPSYHP
jgi:hypothetical protein